jgi:WD40 repeat protein
MTPFRSIDVLLARHNELLTSNVPAEGVYEADFLKDVKNFIRRGRETGARLESVSERRTAQSLLNLWVTTLYRAGETECPDAILVPYSTQETHLTDAQYPYIGLKSYSAADRDRFHGRQGITKRLIKRLVENSLVLLVGPASSGRTSVINAAIIPELKEGRLPGSQDWHYFKPIAPGRKPLLSLASLLVPPNGEAGTTIEQKAERLLQNPDYLAQQLNDEKLGGQPALIVVDRFEEVFTLSKDDARRDAFIANLLNLTKSLEPSTPKHRVILVTRSDRTGYIIQRKDLNDLYSKAEIRIFPLLQNDLNAVIKEPAAEIGLRFQPGLVEQLIREIYSDPSGLPLLQFTLCKLWEDRDGDTLTWAAMNRLGNCKWGLVQSARDFYESLTSELQRTARLVFLRMVRITDALEVVGDRVRREDFYQAGETPERVNSILEGLTKAKIVRVTKVEAPDSRDNEGTKAEVSSDDQFQLVHETLWRDWKEFTTWLKSLRETFVMRQRLETLAANWVILGRKSSGLLDKYQLHEAKTWMQGQEAAQLGYDPDLTALVAKSQEAIGRKAFGRKAWSIGFVTTVLIALALFIALAVFEHNRLREATSHRLAERARDLKKTQLDLALLLSLEAYSKDPKSPEALKSLINSLAYSPRISAFLQAQEKSNQLVFSPDGSRLSCLDVNGKTSLWDVRTLRRIDKSLASPPAPTNGDLLSHDGRWLVSLGEGNSLVVRNVETNEHVQSIPVSADRTTTIASRLAFSHDDKMLAFLTTVVSASPGKEDEIQKFELMLWDTAGQKKVHSIFVDDELQEIAFSPDGLILATATSEGDIVLRRTDDLKPKGKPLPGAFNLSSTNRIVFGNDGKKIASRDAEGAVRVWSVDDQKQLATIDLEGEGIRAGTLSNRVSAFALSHSLKRLVAGYDDGTVVFWTVDKQRPDAQFPGRHGSLVTNIAFRADDQQVVTTASETDSVLLWGNGPEWEEVELPTGRGGGVRRIAFSHDATTLAAATDDGTIVLWDLQRERLGEPLNARADGKSPFEGAVTDQVFTADGKLLYRTESDQVISFDVGTKEKMGDFSSNPKGGQSGGPVSQVADAIFSQNGKVLIVRLLNNAITIWDAETGSLRGSLPTNGASDAKVNPLAINRDGTKLAVGNASEIVFWDVNSRKQISSLQQGATVVALAFNREGTKLISGTAAGQTTVWNVNDGQRLFNLGDKNASRISNVGFSPDGSKLVSISDDGTLHMWDAEGQPFSQFGLDINSFVFSPESKTLGGVRNDGSIIFWDIEAQEEIGSFTLGNTSPVISLAYAPDGKTLAAGHKDGTILLVKIGIETWSNLACRIANRNLSRLEMEKFRIFEDQAWRRWIGFLKSPESLYTGTCPNLPVDKGETERPTPAS